MITYRQRLVHFAATMKQIDSEVDEWIAKFERLLRMLYWERAYLRIETAYLGVHEWTWRVPHEWISNLSEGRLFPITEWERTKTMDG